MSKTKAAPREVAAESPLQVLEAFGKTRADVLADRVMAPGTLDRILGGEPGANTGSIEDLADYCGAPHVRMYAAYAHARALWEAA